MKVIHDKRNLHVDEETQKAHVDDIFAQADLEMAAQQKKFSNAPRQYRNKLKKMKRNMVTFFIIAAILFIVICVVGIAITVNSTIQATKLTTYQSLVEMRNTILTTVTENPTPEEYYAKQLMTIITEEDLQNIVNKATSVREITAILNGEELLSVEWLPAEKTKQVEALMQEYAVLKEQELTAAETTDTITEETVVKTESEEEIVSPAENSDNQN